MGRISSTHKPVRQLIIILGAVFSFVALTIALAFSRILIDVDLNVRAAVDEFVPNWARTVSGYATRIGQGGPLAAIAALVALVLSLRSRTFKPLVLWVMTFVPLFVLLGTIKTLTRRGAPADPITHAVELFSKPFCGGPACLSYPSGHVVGAIVWYGLLVLLLGNMLTRNSARFLTVIPAAITAVVVVTSGHHWLTDSVAAIFFGVAVMCTIKMINPWIPELAYPSKPGTRGSLQDRR